MQSFRNMIYASALPGTVLGTFSALWRGGAGVLRAACLGLLMAPVITFAQSDDTAPSVEEILTGEPDAASYGEPVDCIQTQRIRSFDVLDDQHVVVEMSGSQYYLIQFDYRCPGLRRHRPVIYEPRGGNRFCKLDALRATYDNGLGNLQPGMRCSVPGFQSVTKEQVVMLKDALKIERRKSKSDQEPAAEPPQETSPESTPQTTPQSGQDS